MAKGKIPARVAYAVRQPHEGKDIFGQTITVIETYPFNPDSKSNTRDNARRWGQQGWGKGNDFEPPIFEFNNKPFSIKILKLEYRGRGGRAYKVVDDNGRLFDFREDQLIEAIKHTGIDSGGHVKGTVVWASVSSQFKLVLVEGDTYKSLETASQTKKLKKTAITGSKLEVGGVYAQNGGSCMAYLGRVKAPGAKKFLYAFVGMGFQHSEGWSDTSGEYYPHSDDHWQDRTWRERWEARCFKSGTTHGTTGIILIVTPKFDAQVGSMIVDDIRDNTAGAFFYTNGCGEKLVEPWVREHSTLHWPDYPPYFPSWRATSSEATKHELKVKAYYDKIYKLNESYRDALEWK